MNPSYLMNLMFRLCLKFLKNHLIQINLKYQLNLSFHLFLK